MKKRTIDNIEFYPNDGSNNIIFVGNKNKKYAAWVSKLDTYVFFGDKRYQQFHDRIGFFDNLDHLDNIRRGNYIKRHGSILLSNGDLAFKKKYSPAWFSMKYLW